MKKTVLITGTSTGFGKESTKLFQKKGWNVIATMRSPEKEEELIKLENVLVTRLDVQDNTSIRKAIKEGIEKFGKIDALINNAGYGAIGIFESSTQDHVRKQFEVNVFGLMDVTREMLPHFRTNGKGVIVNISSYGGRVALPIGSLYNASKFAVEGFSESLAHELAALNISVKLIEPGGVATNLRNNMVMIKNETPGYEKLASSFWQLHTKSTQQLKKATPEDVAIAIYEATTDETKKMRYVVGDDAQFFIDRKFNATEQDYMKEMHDYYVN